jgi:hypothetical protein
MNIRPVARLSAAAVPAPGLIVAHASDDPGVRLVSPSTEVTSLYRDLEMLLRYQILSYN